MADPLRNRFLALAPMTGQATTKRAPYTCFACRSTFRCRHEHAVQYRKCPNCGGQAIRMDASFCPPGKSDERQWSKVHFLVDHGFVFQRVYRKEGSVWHCERYPDNLEQARTFVVQFRDQALPIPMP